MFACEGVGDEKAELVFSGEFGKVSSSDRLFVCRGMGCGGLTLVFHEKLGRISSSGRLFYERRRRTKRKLSCPRSWEGFSVRGFFLFSFFGGVGSERGRE